MSEILAVPGAFVLGAEKTFVTRDPAIGYAVRKALTENNCVYFRHVIEPKMLAQIMGYADRAVYDYEDVGELGYRQKEAEDRLGSVMRTMLGRPSLLNWMTGVSQSAPLTSTSGRFVESRDGGGEGLTWHSDLLDRRRRLAIVINFTRNPYAGGDFQMGRRGDDAPSITFAHFEPGGAMVFKLSDHMLHRVTQVTAGGPRRVFAGWFETETDLPLEPRPQTRGMDLTSEERCLAAGG